MIAHLKYEQKTLIAHLKYEQKTLIAHLKNAGSECVAEDENNDFQDIDHTLTEYIVTWGRQ